MSPNKSILLVEDDDLDARTVQRALKELRVTNPLARVSNGEEALQWLRHPANATPGVILLDLNLPVMSGIEFLEVTKTDERLKLIPVVVLTTSKLEEDKLATFKFSVAGYMVKPVDYVQFVEVVRTIGLYWTLSETP
ncbi:MAG TPA: response regulator [Clostridia bacterium]|nr:response regulator [Clostridia bacterium]